MNGALVTGDSKPVRLITLGESQAVYTGTLNTTPQLLQDRRISTNRAKALQRIKPADLGVMTHHKVAAAQIVYEPLLRTYCFQKLETGTKKLKLRGEACIV